jgi:hypothetical protein
VAVNVEPHAGEADSRWRVAEVRAEDGELLGLQINADTGDDNGRGLRAAGERQRGNGDDEAKHVQSLQTKHGTSVVGVEGQPLTR